MDDTHTEAAELREQIEGKNELIAALVAELEQVVEQLDRVKRNGTDRSRTGSTGPALPAEVVEEHQQVLGDLQRVVKQWEAMQAAATLGRIESDLTELRAMVASGFIHGFGDDHSASANASAGHCTKKGSDPVHVQSHSAGNLESVMSRLAIENAAGETSTNSAGTAWESMKRQMLGEPPESVAERDVEDDLTKLLDGIAAPVPIDFESITVEGLKRACADRDTYIVQITRWVRTRRSVTVPQNWDEIQGVPEELHRQVGHLASRLEEQVRLAEVEMSLERARMSREKSQLQADRAVMEKHLKRLGITSLDELEDIAVSSSSSGDRRWMRFLGVNRKG